MNGDKGTSITIMSVVSEDIKARWKDLDTVDSS